ncbi:MAG: glycosyltransferase [Flavobacterium sp.]|nr:glycosyltransferase [Flavobacterium sp.]
MTLKENPTISMPQSPDKTPLVSVVCHTFDHVNFISKTIESLLNQKTDFLFEIIVHDDASTDGTKAIVAEYYEKYPNIIVPIYQKENRHSKKINIWTHFTFPAARGKYIALCEGDDYWTDEHKLQTQVEFLEQNEDFSICWTNYTIKKGNTFRESNLNISQEYFKIDLNNIFDPYCTMSLTCVFRKDRLFLDQLDGLKRFKDNSLYLLLLKNGDGMFINKKTSVYRIHDGGVFSLKSFFFQQYSSYLNIKELYDQDLAFQNDNIKKTLRNLLQNAAFEAVDVFFTNRSEFTKDMKHVVWHYFFQSSVKLKIRFIKRIAKKAFKIK